MPEQAVNKYVIRQSMKALQDQQVFHSLEELAESIADDLFKEGFTVSNEDKAKIAKIVKEEGYTGRFAIDDLVKRKLKNKKLLPLVSLVMAALAFFLTTTVAALIEHYVQKPLEDSRSAPLTAVFQLPEQTGTQLHFQVKLSNLSGEALQNVVLFASADQVTRQFPVEPLESGQSLTVTGTLDVSGVDGQEMDFVAYVIAGDFSLRSQPTRIARRSMQIALAEPPESVVAAPEMSMAEVQENPTAVRRMAKAEAPGRMKSQQNVASAKIAGSKQNAPSFTASAPAPIQEERTDEGLDDGYEIQQAPSEETSFKTVQSTTLQGNEEVARLAERDDAVSRELLKAYAAAGNPEAIKLTSGH